MRFRVKSCGLGKGRGACHGSQRGCRERQKAGGAPVGAPPALSPAFVLRAVAGTGVARATRAVDIVLPAGGHVEIALSQPITVKAR